MKLPSRFRMIHWLPIGALAGLVLLSGCGILESEEPTRARLVLGGAAGQPLELVISDDFDVILGEDGETRSVQVVAADTTNVTAPFDERYHLGSRKRFFAKLSSESVLSTPVSMRVFIGGEVRYDRQSTFDGESMEFVFAIR